MPSSEPRRRRSALAAATRAVAYGAAEVLTGGRGVQRVVNGDTVRFPAAVCRYYPATYEPAKHAFLRRECRPGSTVLDVGAHIGLYTVLMASWVGRDGLVVGFEPAPGTRAALERTVALNRCASVVEIRGEAVGRQVGRGVLHHTGHRFSNANSLIDGPRARHRVGVGVVSLDAFVADRGLAPGVVKIDVEGAELDVLEGSAGILETHRPAVALEVHPEALERAGRRPGELWELLAAHAMAVRSGDRDVDEAWFLSRWDPFELQAVPRERPGVG